eukprot:Awhi_evm1s8214
MKMITIVPSEEAPISGVIGIDKTSVFNKDTDTEYFTVHMDITLLENSFGGKGSLVLNGYPEG